MKHQTSFGYNVPHNTTMSFSLDTGRGSPGPVLDPMFLSTNAPSPPSLSEFHAIFSRFGIQAGPQGMPIYFRQMKTKIIIRNNDISGVRLRLYWIKPRRGISRCETEEQYTRVNQYFNAALTAHAQVLDTQLEPYDLQDFVSRWKIVTRREKWLLPAQMMTLRLDSPVNGFHNSASMNENLFSIRYARSLLVLADGPPSHQNNGASQVNTAGGHIDLIVRSKAMVRFDEQQPNQFFKSASLPIVTTHVINQRQSGEKENVVLPPL